ncbi:MAG TPA: glycosyltransferase [Armatimonadota bacterium]|jgi:hypothetical protein
MVKKIALFDSEASLGEPQRFLLDLCGGLLVRRWEVTVILGQDGPLHDACLRRGAAVHVMPCDVTSRGWRDSGRLTRYCLRQRLRCLYAQTPYGALLGGTAMRLTHGQAYWRLYATEDLAVDARRARWAGQLCTQVHPAYPEVTQHARTCLHRRTTVIPMPPAIDLQAFHASDPPVRQRNARPVVGLLGDWHAQHGQEVLVKAFRLLHEGAHGARLRLASVRFASVDERYRSVVVGAIKAAGLADRIIIEGEVNDLPAFFAQCDILAAPVLGATTGRLALEAAAAGRPLVTSGVPGMRDIVEDGHTGLLAPANQPRDLADALALLIASPALRSEMGKQARMRAESCYSLETLLDTLEERFLTATYK